MNVVSVTDPDVIAARELVAQYEVALDQAVERADEYRALAEDTNERLMACERHLVRAAQAESLDEVRSMYADYLAWLSERLP